jgi:hypothetical protein
MISCPQVGQLVVVRKRPFVVMEVVPSVVGVTDTNGGSTSLISLSSVEDDGLGEELQVVWELEPGATIQQQSTLPRSTEFRPPEASPGFFGCGTVGRSVAS